MTTTGFAELTLETSDLERLEAWDPEGDVVEAWDFLERDEDVEELRSTEASSGGAAA